MSSRLYLTSYDVCRLHCCLPCHCLIVFIVALSPASSCHYHGFHPTLPRFTGFAQQSVRVLSSTVAFLAQSLPPSVSFVCLPYHHRVRMLHRCPHCFHHYIVVCIIDAMSYHTLLRFVCICTTISPLFVYLFHSMFTSTPHHASA